MAVPPKFTGQLLLATTTAAAATSTSPHTLEIYLDYVCPFSAKLFNTFYNQVFPVIKARYANPGVRVIFRQQIQPWHPSSTLVHEAGLAVLKTRPEGFWDFSRALFEHQKEFFDVAVVNEPRNQTYARLAKLASQSLSSSSSTPGGSAGVDEATIYNLLKIDTEATDERSLNAGNQVTNDVKLIVKMNRLTGVHVTPTVVWNGVVENSISSSWTKEQWEEWLEKNAR